MARYNYQKAIQNVVSHLYIYVYFVYYGVHRHTYKPPSTLITLSVLSTIIRNVYRNAKLHRSLCTEYRNVEWKQINLITY